jgi:polyisoprenoid-binding protein YceI
MWGMVSRQVSVALLAVALAVPRPGVARDAPAAEMRMDASGSSPVPAATLREGTLSFDGHATTGSFVGTTHDVRGAVEASADYASLRGWVEASVATLRTGNGLRDRDLRKVMDVGRFPTMRYDLHGAAVEAEHGDSARLVLHGTLRLHGVERAVDVPVTVARTGDAARVVGAFPLNVVDYQVSGLSKMLGMLQMHDRIEVHLDLSFAGQR